MGGMLSSVLTDQERQDLVKNEQISQNLIDSLDVKQDIDSQSFKGDSRSQSPSLLEPFEKDLQKNMDLIDIKYGLGPSQNRIETTWGEFGDSQVSSSSQENRIVDNNDHQVDCDESTEVNSTASTQI